MVDSTSVNFMYHSRDYTIGHGKPVFIIAEAGVNHNGKMDLAYQLVDIAKQAGADAVKFQSFIPEELVSVTHRQADYQVANTGKKQSQLEMLRELSLSFEQQAKLKDYCDKAGILFLSTPFEAKSLAFLAELGVPALKISSTDTTNIMLLQKAAKTGLPILLSTGMCKMSEVQKAVSTFRAAGGKSLALFHCTSLYPAPAHAIHLNAMLPMRDTFKVPVGYSDHTPGIDVSVAAVALGAALIEKHFTIDKSLPGPDHVASLDPSELKQLVRSIRFIENALGQPVKEPVPEELPMKAVMQKHLFARNAIRVGEKLSEDNVMPLRAEIGISAFDWDRVVGKAATKEIPAGHPILDDSL